MRVDVATGLMVGVKQVLSPFFDERRAIFPWCHIDENFRRHSALSPCPGNFPSHTEMPACLSRCAVSKSGNPITPV